MRKKKAEKEEDITLDFSWLKKLVASKNKSKKVPSNAVPKAAETYEDVSIDLNKVVKFLSKYGFVFLLLIPLVLSFHIRMLPADIPIAEEWARQGIYNSLRNNIADSVAQQYPNLPQQSRDLIINEQLNEFVKTRGQEIEAASKQQAEFIRQRFRDDQGNTYLGDIDSYYWLRYARNLVEKGTYGDEIREDAQYDTRMVAPLGMPADVNIYAYIHAYLYMFLKFFQPGISLMRVAFLTPMFLSLIAVSVAFFIGNKIAGNLAGFISAVLIAVDQTVLSRSLGSDNDMVVIIFPLVIMFFILYAFDSTNLKKIAVYSVISGLFVGVYSFGWSGWWFIFLFILSSGGLYIAYQTAYKLNESRDIKKLFSEQKIRNTFILLLLFALSTYVSLAFFGNSDQFARSFTNPLGIIRIKEAVRGVSLWPNVYTTVAEMNEANFAQIVRSIGGKILFIVALIGAILPLANLEKGNIKISIPYLLASAFYFLFLIDLAVKGRYNIFLLGFFSLPMLVGMTLSLIFKYRVEIKYSLLMTIWFIATIYAATKGVRFILLIAPAFAVSFGAFFGIITEWASKLLGEVLDMNEAIPKAAFILLSILVLIQPVRAGMLTAKYYVPSVNDLWVETLTKIRMESSPDAIINSWWDFGHWFKYWADRPVTFDGASQNSPMAHWIGKVLLTWDEEQAASILRMLDCGSNRAERNIFEEIGNTKKSVGYIYHFLNMTEYETREELLRIMSPEKVEKTLSYLYCNPPENYFITSGDMVGKSGVWAHFGIWDFEKAEIYNYYRRMPYMDFIETLSRELNYSKDEAEKLYFELNSLVTDSEVNNWIAPWPSYGGVVGCTQVNGNLRCNIPFSNQVIPLQINLSTMEAYVNAQQGIFHPNALGYFEGEEYIIKEYTENQMGYGVVLDPNNQTLYFMSEELVGSMFTRLFYLDGKGITRFKKFHDVTDITGSRIITWKVDWDSNG